MRQAILQNKFAKIKENQNMRQLETMQNPEGTQKLESISKYHP